MNAKQPPWDEDAEVSVLGSMLIDSNAVPLVLETLEESMFYAERNRKVMRAMGRLFDKGQPVDPFLLRSELDATGELEGIGTEYIGSLMDAVPTAANVRYHAGVVRDRALRRRIGDAGTSIVRMAYDADGRSAVEVLDSAQRKMHEAANNESGTLVPIRSAIMPAFEMIERAEQSKGGITGVSSGLYDVDELTGGWQKGNLVIIAARPSMGKTALATGLAITAAIENHIPTAIFSLEMTKEEIVQRMLCWGAKVDLGAMMRGRLRDEDYTKLAQVAHPLSEAPLWIDDASSLTVMQVRAKARRLKAEQKDLGLVIVDYLQLMTGDGENRTQEVSGISRGLKALAKELGVPVIALSQLNRAAEGRSDNRPRLSDLRESGAIEQDADIVAFLYRPEKYQGPTSPKGEDLRGKAELIIAKQRNGPTDSVPLYFRDYCARFESTERRLSVA